MRQCCTAFKTLLTTAQGGHGDEVLLLPTVPLRSTISIISIQYWLQLSDSIAIFGW